MGKKIRSSLDYYYTLTIHKRFKKKSCLHSTGSDGRLVNRATATLLLRRQANFLAIRPACVPAVRWQAWRGNPNGHTGACVHVCIPPSFLFFGEQVERWQVGCAARLGEESASEAGAASGRGWGGTKCGMQNRRTSRSWRVMSRRHDRRVESGAD